MGEETSPLRPTLGQIVAYYKYQTAKRINELRGTPGLPFWQRNYWEHVVRDEIDLNRIRQYIANNPLRWHEDQLNPIVRRARRNGKHSCPINPPLSFNGSGITATSCATKELKAYGDAVQSDQVARR